MVAANSTITAETEEAKHTIDLRQIVQDCSKLSTPLKIHVGRERVLRNKALRLEMREYIITDHYSNLYVVFISTLIDRETYAVPVWVGSKSRGLCKEFHSQFKWFDDDMLMYLQNRAFVEFGQMTVALLKGQNAAGVEIAPTGGEIEAGNIVTLDTKVTPKNQPSETAIPVPKDSTLKVIPFVMPKADPVVTATHNPSAN